MISIEYLRQQKLFQGLDPALLTQLGQNMRLIECPKRTVVLSKGAASQDLLLLLDGRLQVVNFAEDGKEVGISFIEAGDYFGELGIIDGEPRSAHVVSVLPSKIALLPKNMARQLLVNHPIVAERVMMRLCSIIRNSTQQRSALAVHSSLARVCSVLLHVIKTPNPNQTINPNQTTPAVIENLPPQHSLATMANVSRETVSRALVQLAKAGILSKNNHKLIILNVAEMQKIARGDTPVPISNKVEKETAASR